MFKRQWIVLVLGFIFVSSPGYATSTDGFFDWFAAPALKKPKKDSSKKKCIKSDWKGIDEVEGVVLRGVDGDTAHVELEGIDMPIRMLSIDTPETNFQGKSQGKWGEAAKEKLHSLLPEKTKVVVELEAEKCDVNGRMLGHIWKGTKNINLEMVRSALAVMYCIFPNDTHCSEYGAVMQKAFDSRDGMFADKALIFPYEWRRIMRKEPRSKYIGSLDTQEVLKPEYLDEVEVGDRIFFQEISDIQDPYLLVDGR